MDINTLDNYDQQTFIHFSTDSFGHDGQANYSSNISTKTVTYDDYYTQIKIDNNLCSLKLSSNNTKNVGHELT